MFWHARHDARRVCHAVSPWCMWSSPMALSFDPRANTVTKEYLKILTNRHLIALNQDQMGQQADLISDTDNLVMFAKDLENGDVALSVTNMSGKPLEATFHFTQIPALDANKRYQCRDLWTGEKLHAVKHCFTTKVRPHATRVFRLSL